MSEILCQLGCWPLNGHSLQDAHRAFSQPIKTNEARLDFYRMYNREATEYDKTGAMEFNKDLNTTLVLVSHPPFIFTTYLTFFFFFYRRPVCFLPSVHPSSSISTRSSKLIQMNNQWPSSVQSFLPSTNPLPQVKPLPFHLPEKPSR